MKLKFFILLILALGAAAAWYFLSPLFINTVVDESIERAEVLTGGFENIDTSNMTEEEMSQMERQIVTEMANEPPVVASETMPTMSHEAGTTPGPVRSGQFMDADNFHKASGLAGLYTDPLSGRSFVRFEDFQVTNGPDLRVYLSPVANPQRASDVTNGGIELARLKGNIGNQNYDIPEGINLDDFQSVVVYCKPFRTIFGSAALQ